VFTKGLNKIARKHIIPRSDVSQIVVVYFLGILAVHCR